MPAWQQIRLSKIDSSFVEKKEERYGLPLDKYIYCVYTVYIDIHSKTELFYRERGFGYAFYSTA